MNGKASLARRRCRGPFDSLRRPTELRQDHASGRGPGTWPGQHLRGPALPVRIPRKSTSGLQLLMLQNRTMPGSMADRRHHHRGSRAAAAGTQRATGNGPGRNEGPDRPHVEPHRPDLGPGFGQSAQGCLHRICHRPRCPQPDHRHRPHRLPIWIAASGSRPGISARPSITGRSGGEVSACFRSIEPVIFIQKGKQSWV